ncbi:MAG: hypothetical protein ACRDVE_18960 [Actinocrinis sp.]
MSAFMYPTALVDQIEAAEADLERILNRAAPAFSMDFHEEIPTGWLAERIDQFVRDLLTDRLECCEHLTRGPRPAFAALATPGLVVCQLCTKRLVGDPDAELPCDRCGGNGPEAQLTAANLGTVVLLIVECDHCASLTN